MNCPNCGKPLTQTREKIYICYHCWQHDGKFEFTEQDLEEEKSK